MGGAEVSRGPSHLDIIVRVPVTGSARVSAGDYDFRKVAISHCLTPASWKV